MRVMNNGTIDVQTGTLSITQSVSGDGFFRTRTGAVLEVTSGSIISEGTWLAESGEIDLGGELTFIGTGATFRLDGVGSQITGITDSSGTLATINGKLELLNGAEGLLGAIFTENNGEVVVDSTSAINSGTIRNQNLLRGGGYVDQVIAAGGEIRGESILDIGSLSDFTGTVTTITGHVRGQTVDLDSEFDVPLGATLESIGVLNLASPGVIRGAGTVDANVTATGSELEGVTVTGNATLVVGTLNGATVNGNVTTSGNSLLTGTSVNIGGSLSISSDTTSLGNGTVVNAGSDVGIAAGATLGGTGTINNNVNVLGIVADVIVTGNATITGGSLNGASINGNVTTSGNSLLTGTSVNIGGSLDMASGTTTVGNGTLVNVALTTTLGNTATLTINGDGLTTGSFDNTAGGTFNLNDSELTVIGGTFDQGSVDLTVNGPTAAELPTVNITGGATTSNVVDVTIGNNNRGELNILSGGLVSNAIGYIGRLAGSYGTVTVDGIGSTWTNSSNLNVGNLGTGTLTIETGGLVDVALTTTIGSLGTLTINGGTLRTAALDMAGGSLQLNSGTLNFSSDLQVSPGDDLAEVLGVTHTVGIGQQLVVEGTTTLLTTLDLSGGTFSTASLVNPVPFQFNSGTFNLTGDDLTIGTGGLLGRTLSLSASQTVNVLNNSTVDANGLLFINGGSFSSGTSLTNNGEIQLAGSLSQVAGGMLTNNGLILGEGTIPRQTHTKSFVGQVLA